MEELFNELGLDSVLLAKALRYAGQRQSRQFNMTQIHKLLYIAYGTYLVQQKARLTKEHPSAWPYGPVFPRVQKHVRLYDDISSTEYESLDPGIKELLNSVVSTYGNIPATTLSIWSHEDTALGIWL